jgi:formyl-CoA transferase/CoA:oxalate CoA-transferase
MAGPYATAFLSDFGADVIKVESTPDGDPSRQTGVHFVGGESALFLMWNRGKRSIQVNLHTEKGLETVRRLARHCDVVIQNFRPGVAEQVGIGYSELSRDHPELIYVSISAFGRGPLEDLPGTDPIVQAMSGIMSVTGEADRGPALVGVPIADFVGAMMAVTAVNFGLIARQSTGVGQHIEVSMLYGLMSSLATRLAAFWSDGIDPVRSSGAHSAVAPYQAYQTADGWAVAGVWGPRGWPAFCEAVGRPDLINDKMFESNRDRVANRDMLNSILIPLFKTLSTDAWGTRFAQSGALFSPVNRFSDIFGHPHIEASGLVREIEHETLGMIKQLGPPLLLSGTPGRMRRPPPVLGAHTIEVLREFGFTPEEILELQQAEAIGGEGGT